MSVNFVLEGQEFVALNGGPQFTFAEGISLFVNCETQAEVDELWDKLLAGGGTRGAGRGLHDTGRGPIEPLSDTTSTTNPDRLATFQTSAAGTMRPPHR